jgi:transposase
MARKGRRATYDERVWAVREIEGGMSPDVAADILNVGRESVFRWWREYRAGGVEALRTKKTRGRPAKLDDAQMRRLFTLIEGANPRQLSFDFGLWTRKLVGELIWQEFRVRLSDPAVGRLLRKMGMSPQRPLYRAYQQNPERVEAWKTTEYPAIRARAAREGAVIFFADESSVRTDYHAGTTWAPVGRTPVVPATGGTRAAVKMISAISLTGQVRFHVQTGSMDRWTFIAFCKQLISDFDKKIFLIVDGSSIHSAGAVADFVARNTDRIELFFLPPYSPELNPDEWVNKNVKHDRVARAVIQSEDDLWNLMLGALRRLQKTPNIVRAFFRDPALSYILAAEI